MSVARRNVFVLMISKSFFRINRGLDCSALPLWLTNKQLTLSSTVKTDYHITVKLQFCPPIFHYTNLIIISHWHIYKVRHCTFKTVLERKQRRSGFSAEMQRHEEKAQKWRAVADCARHKQRRPGRLNSQQWRVEFGGQSVTKTRPITVAVEPRDQLVSRVRRWGTVVPTHADICIRGWRVLSQSILYV